MLTPNLSYEETRRKRVEENRKQLEALNLPQLSQALCSSPKPSQMKKKPRITKKEVVIVRRSSRVANKPTPIYKEVEIERVVRPRRVSSGRRDLNRVYASDEARAAAIEQAEKLQSGLEDEYPSFVKPMLQSHVSGGFWLGLPNSFGRKHLPKRDETIILVDEDDDEYPTVYLAHKLGLSGGWRGFSIAHELADGDALVFQLISRTKFKVYIIRASDFEEGTQN